MNAHEAIWQVEELKGYIEQLNKYSNSEPKIVLDEFIELVNPDILEALSIVLESAKALHEHLGYSDKEYEGEEEYFTMDIESIRFDDPLTLTKTDVEKIGYELDSDYDWKELRTEKGADE